jgi:hypothetical protein
MRDSLKSLVALALAVAVLVYPATALASEGEGTAAEGMIAGQADGRANTSGILWMGAGCLFEVLGVAVAYLYTPSPSVTHLLGKSSDYVAAYTDAYGNAAKNVQTRNAWIGCIASTAAYVGIWIVAAIVAAANGPY